LNEQRYPSLKTEANGDFVVAWQSYAQDGSYLGIFGRQFSSAGAPIAAEFQVNTYTPDQQYAPAVAGGAGGAFVVTWTSRYQDGAEGGVFAQRFAMPLTLDVDGDGTAQPLTDGLLLLRYLFGFRDTTLTNGAVGAGCTRCDAPSIEAYLASLTE
jgi:hypothetical protein